MSEPKKDAANRQIATSTDNTTARSGLRLTSKYIGMDSDATRRFLEAIPASAMSAFNSAAEATAKAIKKATDSSSALARSKDFSKAIESLTSSFPSAEATASMYAASITDALQPFLVLETTIFDLQPQLFESLRAMAVKIPVPALSLNLAGTKAECNLHLLAERYKRAEWPLYSVDDEKLSDEVLALDASLSDKELQRQIRDIAYKYLDKRWVSETENKWHSLLKEGNAQIESILRRALHNHAEGHYMESVALLMCAFDSFFSDYADVTFSMTEKQKNEYLHAVEDCKVESKITDSGALKVVSMKQKPIVMALFTQEGWETWGSAANYIVNFIMADKKSAGSIGRHPKRHLICHGKQTEFDDWEYSIKAILATDLVLTMSDSARTLSALN